MSEPLRVLFVCTANICRSPTMELLAREMARDLVGDGAVEFASAGTHARDGEPINPDMAATLRPGIGEQFRSRRATRDVLAAADLVLTAEEVHRRHLLDDHPRLHRTIFTLGQFAATIGALPGLAGRELVEAAGRRRVAAAPEHDVADPYRRGAAASEAATATITAMLSAIVPRLVGTHQHQEG